MTKDKAEARFLKRTQRRALQKMKVKYEFPKRWCIKVTEENQQVLSAWRFIDGQKAPLECYVGISKYGGPGHTFFKERIWPDILKFHLKTLKSMC